MHTSSGNTVEAIRVREMLQGKPTSAVAVPPAILAQYVGDYRLAPDLEIRFSGSGLTAAMGRQAPADLVAQTRTHFGAYPSGGLQFRAETDGAVSSLVVHILGVELSGAKVK